MLSVFISPLAAQNQNDLKRAQEFYEKALQAKKPAERVELLQKAVQVYEARQATALAPASQRQIAMIHFALGREFFQQAKWQAAIAHLEKTIASDSTIFFAHTTLGLIYFQQRKYDAAISAYNRALSAQPTAQLYNNLGAAYEAKGDLSAAVEAYRRALAMDAKLVLAQKNLQRAQEKLALTSPLTTSEEKLAAADSARLAAQHRDSLAAMAQKSLQSLAKTKSAKDKKAETAKTLGAKTKSVVERNKSAEMAQKNKLIPAKREPEAAISSAPRSSILKKDSANQDLPKAVKQPNFSSAESQHPSLTSTAPKASGSSAFAYLCGAGVVLFGVLIFTQRHRLGRMWLQFKPSLAPFITGVMRIERLLSTIARVSVNESHDEPQSKLLPSQTPAPLGAEQAAAMAEKPESFATDESPESRQPSLQTQAFFAEMIAAEPEIDDFDDESKEDADQFSAAINPTNGHTALPSADSLPLPNEDNVVNHENPSTSSPPIVVPMATLNGQNRHPFLSPSETETLVDLVKSEPVIEISATSEKLNFTETNRHSIETFAPRDNELSEISDQKSVASDQLSVISTQLQTLGRYLIEREIGKGAMGKVYLALDPKLDRRVVIKTVCFDLAASETDTAGLKDRIYREARAIAKLSHPNIVVVYDVEDDKELSYIVMEHIEGRDLRQALNYERRFDFERTIKIIAQVCSALDYAHQAGIVHRDIKPSNIMLLPNDKAKVTDFGIAKIADNFSLTLPGHVLGTPSYMAPEQFEGEAIDGRADIFSLGVVFYELLTGCRPFAGDSLAALAYKIVHKMHVPPSLQNVELPLEFDEIVGRALAKQPEERYQTVQEFRDALLAVKFALAA